MEKINITLDVSKINKDKIVERKYKNKNGEEIVEKNYKIEVVPTKEKKMVTSGPSWVLMKTHYVVEAQTKEEKANKEKQNYVGNGYQFESKQGDLMAEANPFTKDSNPF